MDGASEGFLAVPGFADDQDRQAVAGGLGGHREGGAKVGRGADQLLKRQVGRRFLGQGRKLAGGAAAVGDGRSAPRAGAPEQPAWPGSRWRLRASRRPPASIEPPSARTMTGRSGRTLRMAAMRPGPLSLSQLDNREARTSRPWGPCSRPAAVCGSAALTTLQPARDASRRRRAARRDRHRPDSDQSRTSSRMGPSACHVPGR